MKDFFISYNRADRKWAEWIAWQLEATGQTVVIQAWDFREGGNFVLDMQRALEEAERTLIVLSPDFLKSSFTAPEWAAAFARDPTGSKGLLVPVRVRECQPGGLLAQVVYIDLVGLKSRDEAQKRLLSGITKGRNKPQQDPGMPPLDPGSPQAAQAPEPPWPPSVTLLGRLAGSAFWTAARFVAMTMVLALMALSFLRSSMPQWYEGHQDNAHSSSMLLGLVAALVVEGGLRLWRRHRARSSAGDLP